ncbi:MAG: WbuC family cupin fold metalloprotein [Nanoarchaeota archaeon]
MKKIYSKIDPPVLLHIVNRKEEIAPTRQDLSPNEEYLQVACFTLPKGKTFRAHKHLKNIRSTDITQESWVVIKGTIKAILYDLDDKIIEEAILKEGDCSITFHGGHTYESLEENSIVYEYKTGPYKGQDQDKTFIESSDQGA